MKEIKYYFPTLKTRRFYIALLVIIPAFIIIFAMYLTQHSTSIEAVETINELIKMNATDAKITVVADAFEDINTSNQTFFNILLAVFAAWVGAVVAFYFGAENLQQAQQTLQEVVSAKRKLSETTIKELLEDLKEAKNLRTVHMNDTILDVRKKLQDHSNILVLDEDDKPLGVLYRWDLAKFARVDIYAPSPTDKEAEEAKTAKEEFNKKKGDAETLKKKAEDAKKAAEKDPSDDVLEKKAEDAKKAAEKAAEEAKTAEDEFNEKNKDNESLSKHIESIKEEFITKKEWKVDKGIKNYAVLDLKDNLLQAKEKMEEIAKSEDDLLSVRAFVLDKESKAIAVINFANLTKGIV